MCKMCDDSVKADAAEAQQHFYKIKKCGKCGSGGTIVDLGACCVVAALVALDQAKCDECQFKRMGQDRDAWCYMFFDAPNVLPCKQFKQKGK